MPGVRIRYPFRGATGSPGADAGFALGGPLRLLYAGRLERRKGVHHLARAVTALPGDDWSLTFVGGDTRTGPLGTSMRDVIGLAGEGDPRVVLEESVSRERLAGLVAEHDVVVLPSLWECWPYAALEALHLNRPVLATPTGGFVEMIRPGAGGWLTRGTSVDDVEDGLRRVLEGARELSARLPVTVLHQPNAGLGAARNFGIRQCRGRYILPLDSDNMVEPEFVARCLALLEARDELAFVTAWSRYIDEDGEPRSGRVDVGYQPFGNVGAANAESNVSGDAGCSRRRGSPTPRSSRATRTGISTVSSSARGAGGRSSPSGCCATGCAPIP